MDDQAENNNPLGHELRRMRTMFTELETSARKLKNQNFADIAKSAHSRITQLAEHPDLDAVHAQLDADHDGGREPLPFPGGEKPAV